VNGYDEVGPYTVIFDTTTDEEADRQISVAWTAGLPRVNCQYGCDNVMTFEPVVLVTPKGGTSEDALEKILLQTIEPLYPDLAPHWIKDADDNIIGGPICHRLDGGPGRTGTASLPMRMRMAEKGIFLFPSGPQNCTAATQEPDQLFGKYKEMCDAITDEIVSERIAERAAVETQIRNKKASKGTKLPKVELSNADLPRVVNGDPEASAEKRPFSAVFAPELVHAANAKVGVCPLTRAALNHPKVRHELGADDDAIGMPRKVADAHVKNMAAARTLGLNTAPLEISVPRRYHPVVAERLPEEDVIRKLADAKCTQSSICGSIAVPCRSTAASCSPQDVSRCRGSWMPR